jgi:hypothetical protein
VRVLGEIMFEALLLVRLCCQFYFNTMTQGEVVKRSLSTDGREWHEGTRVLVQILLSVCFCRVNDSPEFRLPRPWRTFFRRGGCFSG